MEAIRSPDRDKRPADFAAARLFLADLDIEADVFANPRRCEEWLAVIQNLHHTLLALERAWMPFREPAVIPTWFASGSIGQFFAKFTRFFAALPVDELEQLGTDRKFAFHAALVAALTLACAEISVAMKADAGR